MAEDQADGVLSIEEVLAEEAEAIHGTNWQTKTGLIGDLPDQDHTMREPG